MVEAVIDDRQETDTNECVAVGRRRVLYEHQ